MIVPFPQRCFVRLALLSLLFLAVAPAFPRARAGEGTSSRKENLRYAGKTFAEYKKLLLTEIEPSTRLQHLKPMAAFARHGLSLEVTETLLELLTEYDYSFFRPAIEDPAAEPAGTEEEQAENKILGECAEIILKNGPGTIPVLRKCLQSEKKGACLMALAILTEGYGTTAQEAIPEVLALSRNKDPQVAGDALRGLAAILGPKDERVSQAILLGLKHKEPEVRRSAFWVLSYLPDLARQSAPAILQALDAPDSPASKSAVRAAKAAQLRARVVPAMVKLIRRGDVETHKEAFDFLRELGADAREAGPALLESLEDFARKSPRSFVQTVASSDSLLVDPKSGRPVARIEAGGELKPVESGATPKVIWQKVQVRFDAFSAAVEVLASIGPEARPLPRSCANSLTRWIRNARKKFAVPWPRLKRSKGALLSVSLSQAGIMPREEIHPENATMNIPCPECGHPAVAETPTCATAAGL